MTDIFDQIGSTTGDIFDQIAPSVAATATARLAARHLTPEQVKAGGGVVSPDQITFAPPKQMNGGFFGGAFANPLPAMGNAMSNAIDAVMGRTQPSPNQERPTPKTEPEIAVANLLFPAQAIQDTAKESSRRGAANQSTSDMYGQLAQTALLAGAGGLKKGYGMLRALPDEAAATKVANVVDPRGINPELAQKLGTEVIRSGQPLVNPQTEIPQIAEKKISGIDTDTPILNRGSAEAQMAGGQVGPAQVGPILDHLANVRRQMFDANGTPRIGFQDKIASLSAIMKDIAAKADANGDIAPDTLRNLHSDLNHEVGPEGFDAARAANMNAERLSPTMHAAQAVTNTVNEDPAVAAANAEKSQWIGVKNELPQNAPAAPNIKRDIAHVAIAAGGDALASVVPFGGLLKGLAGVGGTVYTAGKLIRDIVTSPEFRTSSAIKRAQIGHLLATGDYAGATKAVGLGMAAADTQNAGDNGAHGQAVGAINHLSNDDLVSVYRGHGAYIAPDGTMTPLPFNQ